MVDFNQILKDVISDAASIGFNIPNCLEKRIYFDNNRYDRVGACYRYVWPEKYEIHLSDGVKIAKECEVKNIIAHEVLHASVFSMDHNFIWEMYKSKMNKTLGYNIKEKYMWHQILK